MISMRDCRAFITLSKLRLYAKKIVLHSSKQVYEIDFYRKKLNISLYIIHFAL